MRLKSKKGLTGIDMVIAIVALIIFSTLIVSLIYYNAMENIKITRETLAMIFITEIFENIGIEKYDNITQENVINKLVPDKIKKNYDVEITVYDNLEESFENQENKIMKKIGVKLTYNVGNKKYDCYMERLKVKE